jgi:hypothetical protein
MRTSRSACRHFNCDGFAERVILKAIQPSRKIKMREFLTRRCFALAMTLTATCSSAYAQTPLSAYVDANGFIDVQKLTCAQLAGTFQEDADALTAWYSGWYNGLAKKHFMDLRKGKVAEHEVIMYCKANPDKLVIEAIAVVFKDERARLGIKMKAD